MKQGGQALLGGLDCLVARNFFGAQINSFETRMPAPPCLQQFSGNGTPVEPYRAVFIRCCAPAWSQKMSTSDCNKSLPCSVMGRGPLQTFMWMIPSDLVTVACLWCRAPGILECGSDLEVLSGRHITASYGVAPIQSLIHTVHFAHRHLAVL